MAMHHMVMHLSTAVLHTLHVGSIRLGGSRLGLKGLLKIRHAWRHSVGENRPGADGKNAESCERNDNCRRLAQVSVPSNLGFGSTGQMRSRLSFLSELAREMVSPSTLLYT